MQPKESMLKSAIFFVFHIRRFPFFILKLCLFIASCAELLVEYHTNFLHREIFLAGALVPAN